MAYRRADVVDRALRLLDTTGLAGLSMRRLAGELGVQPGALYHHFAGKAELLGVLADEILARGRRATEVVTWEAELRLVCVELRDAMLAYRDGAELIATAHALGTGAQEPVRRIADALRRAGADADLARVGARTLLHFVFGHVADEQLRPAVEQADHAAGPHAGPSDFAVGLAVLLDGLAVRLGADRVAG